MPPPGTDRPIDMIKTIRGALAALLFATPAAAQQQQGLPRDSDHFGRARSLVEQQRFKDALTLFDSLRHASPDSRAAALGHAKMLAWLGRFNDAIRAYERWIATHPEDAIALEAFAQVLSWAGRFTEAERLFHALALGGSVEAERGLARIAAWRRDYADAERRWRAILDKHPNESNDWVDLARVVRWRNRPHDAREILTRAVKMDRENRDAASELARLEAELSPHVDPHLSSRTDTDGNDVVTMGATAAVAAPWDGELSIRAQRRDAAIDALRTSSLSAVVGVSRSVGALNLRGSLGATRVDDASGASLPGARDVATASAAISARVGRRASVVAVVSRDAFDETAPLIQRGIVANTFGSGASFDLTRRAVMTAELEHVLLRGATPNARTGGSASLSWRAPRVLSLAATVRGYRYAEDPREGYFAPSRYLLGETSAQLRLGRELGWLATLDGGVGVQSIDLRGVGSATQPSARGSLTLLYRPSHGFEWGGFANVANAASPARSGLGDYQTSAVGLRARIRI